MTGKLTFDVASDVPFLQAGATSMGDLRYTTATTGARALEYRSTGETSARIFLSSVAASGGITTRYSATGSTHDAPTGPPTGVSLGSYAVSGLRPGASWYTAGQISFVTTEAWTNTATGTEMRLTVIPTGTRTTVTPLIVSGTALTVATNITLTMSEGANVSVGTTTGTKIGTAATQKLGWWNATPVVQNTGWSPTPGYTALKSFNPASYTPDELARVVATLIDTLKTYGLLGGS